MPALHLADRALSVARRADEDPSEQARRLYDRPDAQPLPELIESVRTLPAGLRIDRVMDLLRSMHARIAAAPEQPVTKPEAEAT